MPPARRTWPRRSAWSVTRCGAIRCPRWTPGRCSSPSQLWGRAPMFSCGHTGTAPTPCSPQPSRSWMIRLASSPLRGWGCPHIAPFHGAHRRQTRLKRMSGKTDRPLIAPSILAADFARLGDEAAIVEGADWLHVDVMDAHCVPNLTIGLPVVESLLAATDIPMDCHLMIEDPDRWAPPYAEAGAYNVTFHAEATDNPVAVARDIRAAGAKAGLSIKPGTPLDPYLDILKDFDTFLVMSVEPGFGGQDFIPEVLSKVRTVRKMVDSGELTILVEIDGGINADNIEQAAEAGVDCFVAGSAVYGAGDPRGAVEPVRRRAGAASPHLRQGVLRRPSATTPPCAWPSSTPTRSR